MPDQVPTVAIRLLLRWGVPVTTGALVLAGEAACTVPVGPLGALTVPSGLEAVASSRTSPPSSATASVYELPVAPGMFDQVVPSAERCHCSAYALPTPLQVPWMEVRVTPRCALPEIVGVAVSPRAAAPTPPVATLPTPACPSSLVALISTRNSVPSSPTARE